MKKREDRTKVITVRVSAADYANIRESSARTTCKHFSTYLRKLLMGDPVRINTRDASLDALIESLVSFREQLERLLERPAWDAGEKQQFFEIIGELKQVLNKIADLCILKSY